MGTLQAVAFVKGTRFQPQCGFSYKVLSMLTELRADFEVVNVLDDQFNPGVRDAIKEYSQWPTIPQVCNTLCSALIEVPMSHCSPCSTKLLNQSQLHGSVHPACSCSSAVFQLLPPLKMWQCLTLALARVQGQDSYHHCRSMLEGNSLEELTLLRRCMARES